MLSRWAEASAAVAHSASIATGNVRIILPSTRPSGRASPPCAPVSRWRSARRPRASAARSQKRMDRWDGCRTAGWPSCARHRGRRACARGDDERLPSAIALAQGNVRACVARWADDQERRVGYDAHHRNLGPRSVSSTRTLSYCVLPWPEACRERTTHDHDQRRTRRVGDGEVAPGPDAQPERRYETVTHEARLGANGSIARPPAPAREPFDVERDTATVCVEGCREHKARRGDTGKRACASQHLVVEASAASLVVPLKPHVHGDDGAVARLHPEVHR